MISQVTTPETFEFDAVDDVVADVAAGKIVIVTDDADRENEGDLVMAAEKATAASVNFMAKHGRGLICVPISNGRAEQLGLKRMVAENREMYSTDFTVSVDAADGVTTGISAHDRARTIQVIANPISEPNDLVQPGHVFPLRAKDGGVLRRAGHTEAAVDLATMAGLQPAGVLCEILHDDGTMGVYLHLKQGSVSVREGQRVAVGSPLALSGNTGNSSGPHLHFVVQRNTGMGLVSIPYQFNRPLGALPNFALGKQ